MNYELITKNSKRGITCEKPLACNAKEAERMVELVNKYNFGKFILLQDR